MDALAHPSTVLVKIIRDRRGLVLGRLVEDRSTGRIVARDARSLIAGTYDPRLGTTRDARGIVVAQGDILTALLVRR